MREIKRLMISAMALLVAILCVPQTAFAEDYTYSLELYAVGAPEAAAVDRVLDTNHESWGGMGLSAPSDLAVSPEGDIYVADTGNNRIVVLDGSLHLKEEITALLLPGDRLEDLSSPSGVFVDGNGLLYIADKGNQRVLACDERRTAVKVLTVTGAEVFDERFVFRPLKVSADDLGNTYVISEGSYDGLMQFDSKGSFVGFLGANEVSVNLWDWIWKKLSTQVQRKKMVKSLPMEFDGLDADEEGFVYTVTSIGDTDNPASGDPVRRQNALGQNILKNSVVYGKPVGDLQFPIWDDSTLQGASRLVDVSSQSYGYLCLDETRGRIFAYGDTGEILFILGGYGAEAGKFVRPVAVDAYQDRIYVLDQNTASLTAFTLTDYGRLIIDARQQYLDGKYEESEKSWNEVLRYHSQLPIAHIGIGKVYYMRGEYVQAMRYAKLGGDKMTYSEAYEMYQQEILSRIFGFLVAGIVIAALALFIWYCVRKRRPREKKAGNVPEWVEGLRYSVYISLHPFDGFWDMTHEKRGKMSSACILYGAWVLVWIMDKGMTGFLFRPLNSEFRLLEVLGISVLPVLLWCVCNWAVSTLMDGDGKPSVIVMATAYALAPYIAFKFFAVLLSNVFTLDQGTVLTVMIGFGTIWCVILLVASVITVHNYTLGRSVEVIALIVAAMAIVIFLAILLLNLVDQMRYFLWNLYRELVINV